MATAEVLRDGWVRTQDLGFLDDAGYLHLSGRARDVVIVNAIIHYTGSAPDHVPPDAEVLPVKGRWAMAPGLDFAPLADASLDWLRPAVKELA